MLDILVVDLAVNHNISRASEGFPPMLGASPTMLILGSLPSIKSLKHQQYYANPRNAFWPIMANLFSIDLRLPYKQRCDLLKQHKIAVWDVLRAGQRKGSLDQNIDKKTMIINDFESFLQTHSSIKKLIFNGIKAETVFKQELPSLNISMQRLPSTSPAHAALSFEKKLDAWREALSL